MDGGQEGEARVARSFPVWLSLTSLFSGDLLPHEIASHHRLQKERLTPGPALALSRMVKVRDPHFQPRPPPRLPRSKERRRWNSAGWRPAGKWVFCTTLGDTVQLLQRLASIHGPLEQEQEPRLESKLT